ncbi:hypothetical protein JBL43_03175 [Aureibaculum sp. A20]|uniref:Uncharacterized protein n=1 Tax=Aureibaculum flavum TaxID=2795986 RepID=A0ABS0WMN0_9FLAO|nr:hypothetical protein [Aureibaculum flavum]MBJ2173221.1 hypothetical protein [Aureibaculum flavum]
MKNRTKNPSSIFRSAIFSMLLIIAFSFQSCDTEIPPTDTDPPNFSLKITGEGFDHIFNQDDDFSSFELNLTEDALYDFIFSASDPDGLKSAQMQFPGDHFEIETDLPTTWISRFNNGISTSVTWRGDVNNPVTGAILNGKFRVSGDNLAFGLLLDVRDYGGEAGTSNQTFAELNIDVGQQDTEIHYYSE